jgi:hypothetical protein
VEFTRNLCLMANVEESRVTAAKVKGKLLARHSKCAEPLSVKGECGYFVNCLNIWWDLGLIGEIAFELYSN